VIDGVSGNKAFFLFGRGNVGQYCNTTLKNFYMDEMTTGWVDYHNAFLAFQSDSKNTMLTFESCYFNLNDVMTGAKDEYNELRANKLIFDNCVFAGGKLSAKNPGNDTHKMQIYPLKSADVSENFYGTYAKNPLIEFKNSAVADWESTRFFNLHPAGSELSSYTGNAVKINIENNNFYDVNINDAAESYPRLFSIGKMTTQAQADSFELNVVNNYFNNSDELFEEVTNYHSFFNTNATGSTINIKSSIKNNVFQLPNQEKNIAFFETSSNNSPLFDLSGNLFMDNDGIVQPVRTKHSMNNLTSYFKAQSDLYASDEMKGGVREIMTAKEAEDAVITNCFVQLNDRSSYAQQKDYFQAGVTLILRNDKMYDADKLLSFEDEKVEFLGVYTDPACTNKVETVTMADVNGKYAKASYKAGGTTLNVVYALQTPHTYLIVDPSGSYKENGYTFNGVTYEDCKQASDGAYAKFFTDIAGANGNWPSSNLPKQHYNAQDAVASMTFEYKLEGIGSRMIPYSLSSGTVILMTPGVHEGSNFAPRVSTAVVGPQWGKSPYDATLAAEGKLANGRSTNPATEAIIKFQTTPAVDYALANTVFDGICFVRSDISINLGHVSSIKGSMFQTEVIKNCVFSGTANTPISGVDTVGNKILAATVKDCVFDTTAADRRDVEKSVIDFCGDMVTMKNLAVFSKFCFDTNKFAEITKNSEIKWKSLGDIVEEESFVFYADSHTSTGDNEIEGTKTPATCMADGSVTVNCICGETGVAVLPKDKEAHTGVNTEGVGAKEATCGEKGYTGDVVCECGVVITKGEEIPATGAHTEGEQVTVTEPTVSTDGLATVSCSKCGALIREIVLPKTGEAVIGEKGYATLEEALDNAANGDTVKLLAAAEVDYIALNPGVKLDLNGKTLKTEYVIGFNTSAIFGGQLDVDQDKVALDQNNGGYLPVYDNGVYKFITVVTMKEETKAEGSYCFSPDLSQAHDELLAGAAASGIKVVVRLSWTKAGNYTATQDFVYMDTMVEKVIKSYGKQPEYPEYYTEMFTAVFSGTEADTADDLKICAVLVSDTGVEIASTGMDFSTKN